MASEAEEKKKPSVLLNRKKKKITDVKIRGFGNVANFIFNLMMAILSIMSIFPLIFIIIISISDENSIIMNGYRLIPEAFSLNGYRYLAEMGDQLIQALFITIFVTVVGTLINSTITSLYAYAISRNDFAFRRFFTMLALFSMLFSAGMVPTYIVVTSMLNLGNTVWALILPMALSPFNIIVMRTFFKRSVPESIIEAARIDGATEMRIFVSIVLPLAIPGVATISLFAAIGYWNDWFNALLYINSSHLIPLQYLLMQIQNNIEFLAQNATMSAMTFGQATIPREATRMAIVVIATLPIALSYPFFQRFFVRGLTIGGVKE